MAPDPGTYTVGCSFEKVVPDETHKSIIRDAVTRVHRATILATELLNLHVRRCIEDHGGQGLESVLTDNWLMNAYNEVTHGAKTKVHEGLRYTKDMCMPTFETVNRKGLTQILCYECRNLSTVASNNVWMHFHTRVLAYVRHNFRLNESNYKGLSKDERRHRKLHLLQVAEDLTRLPSEELRSPSHFHPWIRDHRDSLGIDTAVGEWNGKVLLYHLKCHPERFIPAMHTMSTAIESTGGRSFSLFPLRRTLVPRHIRFDQVALRTLCGLGTSDYTKESAAKRRKVQGGGSIPLSSPKQRVRRSKADMHEEKAEAFNAVLDLRAAKVRQRHLFDFAFTTDGVCTRLQFARPSLAKKKTELTSLPSRGLYAIDELKHVSRLEQLHVVGIDPGIREIVVAVDQDDPKAHPVRYTQRQRLKDLRSRRYADESRRCKPYEVTVAEEELAGLNSRTASLGGFCEYCYNRHKTLDFCLKFYADIRHRKRRWKTYIKTQQSEERLYERLKAMHKPGDRRQMVLAYGSWGATSGRAPSSVKRGNPSTVGVGLMKRLSKRFVVCLTPEHHTSKTCCRCMGPCGPWTEVETSKNKKVRGLRICQDESCKLPQNRDRTGASNIGLQFCRLFEGKPPIRSMTDEEKEFHRLQVTCLACDTS